MASPAMSRRQFVRAALLAGAAAALPPAFEVLRQSARAETAPTPYFLDPEQWACCQALCARIVPTGADPATDPGATEAAAVVFVDRFLSAFELPATVADGAPIWVRGRFSGRNPYEGPAGTAGDSYPADDFLSAGQGHFLGLTPAQELSWRVQLYGTAALAGAPAWAAAWAGQVGSLIPDPAPRGGLRQCYVAGLAAFDQWSKALFGVPYARASTEEQDLMLQAAGDVVVSSASGALPVALPVGPPPAAQQLFPFITLHTFQATYGIPEYTWRNQDVDPTVRALGGTAQWRAIGYDGDTQPLGNSLFDAQLYGPGEGPNAGFGAAPGSADAAAGVFVPFGGYREFRPVSTLGSGGTPLSAAYVEPIRRALGAVTSGAGR